MEEQHQYLRQQRRETIKLIQRMAQPTQLPPTNPEESYRKTAEQVQAAIRRHLK